MRVLAFAAASLLWLGLAAAQTVAPSLTGLSSTGISVQTTPEISAPAGGTFVASREPNQQTQSVWERIAQLANVVAIHMVQLPGVPTDRFLLWERPSGYHPVSTRLQIVGTFDLASRTYQYVECATAVFCSGQTVDADGRVVIVGGHKNGSGYAWGLRSIYTYDPQIFDARVKTIVNMTWDRWYATATLTATGQIVAMGGTQSNGVSSPRITNWEIYDPAIPISQDPSMPTILQAFPLESTYRTLAAQNYYPPQFVLPTGDMFIFCNYLSRIYNPLTGAYARNATGGVWAGPNRPFGMLSQYPFTATAAFTAMTPDNDYNSVDVIIFGGSFNGASTNTAPPPGGPYMIAVRHSHRATIRWTARADGTWAYSMTPWTQEDMGMSRVMGDATLLPNGDVVIVNGGQTGAAGDGASASRPGSNYPTFWAQLYQPDRPAGDRYTTLSASNIPRLYHSTAALTMNGTIFVAGCDKCRNITTDVDFMSNSTTAKGALIPSDYRMEIFHPPYVLDPNRPSILAVNGNFDPSSRTEVNLGGTLDVTWSGVAADGTGSLIPVTRVSLVAPSTVTHSFNTNQRVIFLKVVTTDTTGTDQTTGRPFGKVTVQIPTNPNVAIPQWYMLFVMNGKTYSSARWVKVLSSASPAPV